MVKGLVGMRFVKGGRNPRYGLDCWGLVMEVCGRYGVKVPDVRIGEFDKHWEAVEVPNEGDVALIAIHPEHVNHAGVYVGDGRIIHTTAATGAVVTHVKAFGDRIVGYYRYVQGD
jgi:cell wall-associated NlpC family hydrolase